MEAWTAWPLLAALLGTAELLTLPLALGLLAVAALAAGLTGGLTGALRLPLGAQAAVFALGSVAGLVVVRPIARRHVRSRPRSAAAPPRWSDGRR